ncbi:MAG TPA: hypothetical protein VJV78_41555 [Polyangiales bacterium]|nr:hypothetical protein [Polyangiales bacterium]
MSATPQAAPVGAYHPDLMAAGFRYRAPRIPATELRETLTCTLCVNGEILGPNAVVNVSATGIALQSAQPFDVGYLVQRVELRYGDRVVFSAPAIITQHASALGLRFHNAWFDVQALLREDGWRTAVRHLVSTLEQETAQLPATWRAAVADLRHLLDEARRMLDDNAGLLDAQQEAVLFEHAFAVWGPRWLAGIAELHEVSRGLSAVAQVAGRSYAHRLLWPALQSCPMHQRAHDKPQGYAGDYRMMLLYFATQYEGPTRYARFLHFASQRYTLGRAVVLRQACLRAAIRGAAAPGRRTRIISLASGPALELATALECGELSGPAQLVLVDQDQDALGYAHDRLSRLFHARDLDIQLSCLHLSIKQLLSTKPDGERLRRELANADLIYCAGLYDYLPDLVAERLTSVLYGLLRPSGRLYLGNLSEAPDTTWLMNYVLAWTLIYRTPEDMQRFAAALTPAPSEAAIEIDGSGCALFLSVRAPER